MLLILYFLCFFLILYSPLPFLPLNPPIYPSLVSFKSMASFLINCYGMHICLCICIYITKYNLESTYNTTVCMFSWLTVWQWANNWYALPREGHLSHFQLYSVAYSSFCGVEDLCSFPFVVWHSYWCHLCWFSTSEI